MSDLIPLIAATLKDKAAIDAEKEIAGLKEKLALASSVEIIKRGTCNEEDDDDEAVVVYASGQFQEGKYSLLGTDWRVPLKPGTSTSVCRLSEMGNIDVCVGGGFPVASFGNGTPIAATIAAIDNNSEDVYVDLNFQYLGVSVGIEVKGWPRAEWEPLLHDRNIVPAMFQVVVYNVATRFPAATVKFRHVSFDRDRVHGSMKRLIPRQRRQELRANVTDEEPFRALIRFVMRHLRGAGDTSIESIFLRRVEQVTTLLYEAGVAVVNEETGPYIQRIFDAYHGNDEDELQRVVQAVQQERQGNASNDS